MVLEIRAQMKVRHTADDEAPFWARAKWDRSVVSQTSAS